MQYEKSFIQRMQEHLKKNQFPFFPDEDMWGRRIEFDLEHQQIRFVYEEQDATRNTLSPYNLGVQLCRLHQASAGFEWPQNHALNRFGKWPDHWFQKVKRIQNFKDHLYQAGVSSTFEELFLEDYTYFNQLVQVALFYLEDHHYQELVQQAGPLRSIAYRSFSWNNVELTPAGIIFTQPEQWLLDLGVRDLGNFIRASSLQTAQLDETVQLLQGYQQIRQLLPAEYHMIYAQLLYPKGWVQLIEKYLVRHKYPHIDWEQELRKLHEQYLKLEPILGEFGDRIEEEFGVEITKVEWLQ